MGEKLTTNTIINEASKAGAVLGLVSIAYMFIIQITSGLVGSSVIVNFSINILSFVLWGFKFWLCIYLMKTFMQKLVANYEDVTNRDTFKYGVFIALFSAILFSAMSSINMLYISPDVINESMNLVLEQYSEILDSNSMSAMESMTSNMGTISFISNLIYCFLFGTVVSAILSKKIPEVDEFKDFRNNE